MPIIKISISMKKSESGDVFEVVSDDPAFEPDIKAWCDETGNVLNSLTSPARTLLRLSLKNNF